MHVHLRYLSFLAALSIASASPHPNLDEAVRAAIYRIEPDASGFVASNPRQGLTVRFQDGRTEFRHKTGRFSLSLSGESAVSCTSARDKRVEFTRGGVTEWFVNDVDGVEQGFTVAFKRGTGPLELRLDVAGDYAPALEGDTVVLRRDGKTILRYGGLHSWDADGRSLLSHALVAGSQIRLVVDDSSARYPITVDPIVTEAILTASDGVASDAFGAAVAVSGDTAVIGAPNKGSAYVMTRSGSAWTQQGKLTATDAQQSDTFGTSVAVDGDTAVVGAIFTDLTGAAYVFTRSAGQWTQQAKLTASDGAVGDKFGWAVAIAGDTILVGAPIAASPGAAGKAYVFTRAGTAWTQQALLKPGETLNWSNFGSSVALSGDTAAIGASAQDSGSSRHPGAWVFVRSGTLWSEQARLSPADATAPIGNTWLIGASIALSGDTVVMGAPGTPTGGAIYVFTRSGELWSQQAKLAPADVQAGDKFGGSVALSGDAAIVGASGKLNNSGAAYLFSRSGTSWSEFRLNPSSPPLAGDSYGSAAAISGDTILAGSSGYTGKGGAYVFRFDNVSLLSNPSGRTFTLAGLGCGRTGSFTTPYSGLWSNCTVQWTSPDLAAPGARSTFQNWLDNSVQNPRIIALAPDPALTASSFTGSFLTEYMLSTQVVPLSGGSVTGAGWYTAGSNPVVAAPPNSGFVFTGFSGALSGPTTPQTLLMDGPKTVTGNFTNTPPAALSGIISAKSGPVGNRLWTISLTNGGPGAAYNAQVFVLAFVQTFGAACSAMPIRLTPATLPASLGNLAPGANVPTQALIDFSGCPANARFTVNVGYMSNGGASGGLIQLVNQFQ